MSANLALTAQMVAAQQSTYYTAPSVVASGETSNLKWNVSLAAVGLVALGLCYGALPAEEATSSVLFTSPVSTILKPTIPAGPVLTGASYPTTERLSSSASSTEVTSTVSEVSKMSMDEAARAEKNKRLGVAAKATLAGIGTATVLRAAGPAVLRAGLTMSLRVALATTLVGTALIFGWLLLRRWLRKRREAKSEEAEWAVAATAGQESEPVEVLVEKLDMERKELKRRDQEVMAVMGKQASDEAVDESWERGEKARINVVNDVRRDFQRTMSPLVREGEGNVNADDIQRLSNSAMLLTRLMRAVAKKADRVNLQELPLDTWTFQQALEFLLLPSSADLRTVLAEEAAVAIDLSFRLNVIASRNEARKALSKNKNLPDLSNVSLPFLLPVRSGFPRPALLKPGDLLDALAPALTPAEESYAYALEQLVMTGYGSDLADLLVGKGASDPAAFVQRVLSTFNTTAAAGTAETSNILTPDFLSTLGDRVKETEFGDVAQAIRTLDETDRKVLKGWFSDVLEQGWDTLLNRTSVLGPRA